MISKKMRILVIGLGSMGRRRIRLIRKYNPSYEIVGLDLNNQKRIKIEEDFSIKTFSNLKSLLNNDKFDCAFVCTSPLSHGEIIKKCLYFNLHVFTEINLVTELYEKNIEFAKKHEKVLFLSSTFLYRNEVEYIKTKVKALTEQINYTYHVGQYLPDWHPWENIEDYFVSDIKTNGCREILAIELPWIVDIFGNIVNFSSIKSKMSSLNLTYNDNYLIILEHENGNRGILEVDIVSRKPVRNLEVFSENLYLTWDGSPTGLKEYDITEKTDKIINLYNNIDQLDNYSNYIVENAYYSEISTFFDLIESKNKTRYDFEKDKVILDLIDKIES